MLDGQLHQTVIKEECVTGLYYFWQILKAHRYALCTAGDLLGSQYELVARLQSYRLWLDLADAHFWAWQIGHDRHTAAGRLRRRANAPDMLCMTGEVAVREVQPCNVQARA